MASTAILLVTVQETTAASCHGNIYVKARWHSMYLVSHKSPFCFTALDNTLCSTSAVYRLSHEM